MQTMKLRAYQRSGRLETSLDSLVRSQKWAPPEGVRITDRTALSAVLQKLAIKATKSSEGAWAAWRCQDGVRMFVIEMPLELSRERGCPTFTVTYYDDNGRLQRYSLWLHQADETWQQCVL
jgi:hypothetical protein